MKKRNLILHIGSGKTGTTALQSFLKINNGLLHNHGFHYMVSPQWGDNSHHLLGFALWGKEHLGLPNIPNIDISDLFQKMETEINQLDEKITSVVISSELLFEIANTEKINPLIEFINKNFATTNIVAYLRRQDEHIQSLYQHWIKTGHKQFRDKTITQFINNFQGDNYFEKLTAWANHFGKENISVRLYEKQQLKNSDLFADFMSLLNIQDISSFTKPPKDNLNLSINPEATEILRLCGFFDYNQLREVWPDATKTNLTGYSLLSTNDKIKILGKYAESNSKVAKEFLGREDGNLFFSPPPKETELTHINNEMPFEFMVPTLMSIFQNQHTQITKLETELNKLIKVQNQASKTITELKEEIENPFGQKIVFGLNKNNYNSIVFNNHINSVSWLNNELKIEVMDGDPALNFQVPFKKGHEYIFKIILDASDDTTSQLFYLLEGETAYQEKNSVSVLSPKGIVEHQIQLPFKNLLPKLRFDPANKKGTFIIKSILILEK